MHRGSRKPASLLACLVGGVLLLLAGSASAIGPDNYGYQINAVPFEFEDISATGTKVLANHDDSSISANLGFTFNFYGTDRSSVFISSNGLLSFGAANSSFVNANLLTTALSPSVIATLWDDWVSFWSVDDAIYYETRGAPGSRRFIVQWHVLQAFFSSPSTVTFQAVLFEGSNHIQLNYLDTNSGNFASNGSSGTVGIADVGGSITGRALQWSFNAPGVPSGTSLLVTCDPVAIADTYGVRANRTLDIPAPGVIGNDGTCGHPMTAELVSGVSSGALVFNPNGAFTYTPNLGFTGTDGFTYRLTDGTETTDPATVTLLVTQARTLGVVADNARKAATVFDADSNVVLGTVFLPTTGTVGDTGITSDGSVAFVTDTLGGRIWVIDTAATPPKLAGGTNPIPVSNTALDLSITPDQRYLVVSDGNNPAAPISVVSIATRSQVGTLVVGNDTNSVEALSDGSVLSNSFNLGIVRRLTIDGAGVLTNTGETASVGGTGNNGPQNLVGIPGGGSALVVRRIPRDLRSFQVPGLAFGTARNLRGNFGISGAAHPSGTVVYGRSNGPAPGGAVDAIAYDPATGVLGAAPLFTIPIMNTATLFGIEQLALHADGSRIYVSQPVAVKVYDAGSGAPLGQITGLGISTPTGLAVQPNVLRSAVGRTLLAPPNHKLVNVDLSAAATFFHDADPSLTVEVYSDEEDDEHTGAGNHSPDARDLSVGALRLRSERKGNGNGRVYLIIVTATDRFGNSLSSCSTVVVPKSNEASDIAAVRAEALVALAYCEVNGGPPPGYGLIGDGPVRGPHQ